MLFTRLLAALDPVLYIVKTMSSRCCINAGMGSAVWRLLVSVGDFVVKDRWSSSLNVFLWWVRWLEFVLILCKNWNDIKACLTLSGRWWIMWAHVKYIKVVLQQFFFWRFFTQKSKQKSNRETHTQYFCAFNYFGIQHSNMSFSTKFSRISFKCLPKKVCDLQQIHDLLTPLGVEIVLSDKVWYLPLKPLERPFVSCS